MKALFILILLLTSQVQCYAQLDSASIINVSFAQGMVLIEDTFVELPVMEVETWVNAIDSVGMITVDIIEPENHLLIAQKEYQYAEMVSLNLFTPNGILVKIPFLDPEATYQVRVTIQNWRFYYLPQLIYTYPQ